MIDLRPVLFMIGILIVVWGLAMLIPAGVDGWTGHENWMSFIISSFLCVFLGGCIVLGCRTESSDLTIRQAFLFSALSWIILSGVSTFPFLFQSHALSITDAFFESVSGITTTGSTVMTNLGQKSLGILLWRSMIQWLGGIGIIIFAIALLPNLRLGGMQIFRIDSGDQGRRTVPRMAFLSWLITVIYILITILCAVAYGLVGMSVFEAVNHAMTTVSTAGYSTQDSSIGGFKTPAIEWVAILFMGIGSLPFLLYFQAVRGRPLDLIFDPQVRAFFLIVLILSVCLTLVLIIGPSRVSIEPAIRMAVFNCLSIITGTGYTSADYGTWGAFAVTVFFFTMFIGGCAGSTSCGVKIFRWQVLAASIKVEIRRVMQPHQVRHVIYNGHRLDNAVIESVMVYIFIFFGTFVCLSVLLAMTGIDGITALSGAATAIANVGPGLGDIIGPSGTFMPLPDMTKWILIVGMILGRLEFLALLILFRRQFWQD